MHSANGQMSIKYAGPSGPIEHAYWIPELTNDLISMGDLVNLGITININRSGTMHGFYGKRKVFSIPMENNVWKVETKGLFSKILRAIPKSERSNMWWIKHTEEHSKMFMNKRTKLPGGERNENLVSKDLVLVPTTDILKRKVPHIKTTNQLDLYYRNNAIGRRVVLADDCNSYLQVANDSNNSYSSSRRRSILEPQEGVHHESVVLADDCNSNLQVANNNSNSYNNSSSILKHYKSVVLADDCNSNLQVANNNSNSYNNSSSILKHYKSVRLADDCNSSLQVANMIDNVKLFNRSNITSKKDSEISNIIDLMHYRMFHRGKSMIIRDLNANLLKDDTINKYMNDTVLNPDRHISKCKCNSCEKAKSTQIPRLEKNVKKTYTNININERHKFGPGMISTDMAGPYTIKSWQAEYVGSQTFMIMDSKRCFVYGFKNKSEALKNLKSLINEELKPRKIVLNNYHSDNAKELTSKELTKYLKENNCNTSATVPYTPKENSYVERHFRSEHEAVSAALFHARYIPQSFWYLCKKAYNYVYNLMTTNTSKGRMSPYMFDKNLVPDVSHLRVWGCKTWAHIHKAKRSKNFNSKALVGYLVGYSEFQRSAYIVWIPEFNGLIVSRDCKFDENIPRGEIDFTKNDYFHELRIVNHSRTNKEKTVSDFEYLVDNVYYDPDEDLKCLCIVTRIVEDKKRNIVGYFKRIIDNIPEEEEHDYIHVADIEIMMGTYMDVRSDGEVNQLLDDTEVETNPQNILRTCKDEDSHLKNAGIEQVGSTKCIKEIDHVTNPTSRGYPATNSVRRTLGRQDDEVRGPGKRDVTDVSLPNTSYSIANPGTLGVIKMLMMDEYREDINYEDVCNNLVINDPLTFKEAMNSPNSKKWLEAIKVEYDNLKRRGVLKEVAPPNGRNIRAIGSKLVFKTKTKNGKIDKYKVRLVAKGFTQVQWDDYNETFAPVARMNSLRIYLKISLDKSHKRRVIDFTAAYLYGQLNEDLYLTPPDGWECKKGNVLKMERALYGTKQAGRSWYQLIKDYLMKAEGFTMCKSDNCIFYNTDHNMMILLYVDDAIISYKYENDYLNLMRNLRAKFEIGEEGDLDWYLGVKIVDKGDSIFLNQETYIDKLISKYSIEGTIETPMLLDYAILKDKDDELDENFDIKSKIGSLMFASVCTRPDITQAVAYVARFTNHPSLAVCKAITRIFKYLKGSKSKGILLKKGNSKYSLHGDADLGGDINDGKSTSGGCEFIDDSLINWWSVKQTLDTAQSTCDAEVISQNHACKNLVWTRGILMELGHEQMTPSIMYCDSESAIRLLYNPIFHQRTKHLRLKLGFIIDNIEQENCKVVKIKSEDNAADIFTKSQDIKRFIRNIRMFNMEQE